MKLRDLLTKLSGRQTIESIMEELNIPKAKAIYYIHRLRKEGYVKTTRLSNKRRQYKIHFEYKLGTTYEDILNENSPYQISGSEDYIYKDKITLEETLIYAIKSQSIRKILASLALFKKISDWKLLYKLAKENKLTRQVGALYDVAKTIMRTRKMPKRFLNLSLPKKNSGFESIIPYSRTQTYYNIENKWKVRIPLNRGDIEDYLSWTLNP